eukprot:scaffold97016_cov17-Tisochrysis_lutea.AAC.2
MWSVAGQRQWERPVAAAQPIFLPSPTFMGARPGYYFSTGKQGVGYYLDDPSRIAEAECRQPKWHSSAYKVRKHVERSGGVFTSYAKIRRTPLLDLAGGGQAFAKISGIFVCVTPGALQGFWGGWGMVSIYCKDQAGPLPRSRLDHYLVCKGQAGSVGLDLDGVYLGDPGAIGCDDVLDLHSVVGLNSVLSLDGAMGLGGVVG